MAVVINNKIEPSLTVGVHLEWLRPRPLFNGIHINDYSFP